MLLRPQGCVACPLAGSAVGRLERQMGAQLQGLRCVWGRGWELPPLPGAVARRGAHLLLQVVCCQAHHHPCLPVVRAASC